MLEGKTSDEQEVSEEDRFVTIDKKQVEDGYIFCPVCERDIYFYSDYLYGVFSDNLYAYLAAVLVTHYRHNHIRYYDRSWKYGSYAEKNKEYLYMTHEDYKTLVNNRAKRQIIRKIVESEQLDLQAKREMIRGFTHLENNDEKVKEVMNKKLISLEMSQKHCDYCDYPAKYQIILNAKKFLVCGIHKRKKEFKSAQITELKAIIEDKVNLFLAQKEKDI